MGFSSKCPQIVVLHGIHSKALQAPLFCACVYVSRAFETLEYPRFFGWMRKDCYRSHCMMTIAAGALQTRYKYTFCEAKTIHVLKQRSCEETR